MAIKKTDKKYHIQDDGFEAGFNGQGSNPLFEPVPNFLSRPGDHVIQPGIDNNTIIILGRDRDPFRETKEGVSERYFSNPIDDETVSGYSDHMAAGAIDIIVGRGSPYPTPGIGQYPNNLPPLYLTRQEEELKTIELRDGEFHPGHVMDAARIYMSQMCDIDEYFAIKSTENITIDKGPASAIVAKADRIRLHSRRDIKIVAGGDKNTPTDSNGFPIKEKGRIHLIAGNGNYGEQQPIPVGSNLVLCLGEIMSSIQDLAHIVDNFMSAQREVNNAMQNHIHAAGIPIGSPDPVLQAMCENANLTFEEDFEQLQHQRDTNTLNIVSKYLSSGGNNYINSRYNTTT